VTRSALILTFIGGLAAVSAQGPAPTFEVVSIKRSVPDAAAGSSIGIQPGGRFVMVNGHIAELISTAYPADVSEFIGAPDWVNTDRYDITAVAPAGTARGDVEPMLRSVLAERFKFQGHYETRERPIYELVLARSGDQTPAGLRRIDIDCEGRRNARVRGETVPELPRLPNGLTPCSMSMNGGDALEITSGGMTMSDLGRSIQGLVGRVVVDKTGMKGHYVFTLTFASAPRPDSDHVDAFTALQEQLGLKLESGRGNVRMLAIDHIERPTEN
jgi:uncharacterized protein (TIGR03435 family)